MRKIPRSSHSDLKDYNFGVQSFETIQLLSMTKPESEVIIFLLKLNCVLITASLGTTTVRQSSGSMTKKAKKFEECPILYHILLSSILIIKKPTILRCLNQNLNSK